MVEASPEEKGTGKYDMDYDGNAAFDDVDDDLCSLTCFNPGSAATVGQKNYISVGVCIMYLQKYYFFSQSSCHQHIQDQL